MSAYAQLGGTGQLGMIDGSRNLSLTGDPYKADTRVIWQDGTAEWVPTHNLMSAPVPRCDYCGRRGEFNRHYDGSMVALCEVCHSAF